MYSLSYKGKIMVDSLKSTLSHTADKVLHTTTIPETSPISNIGLHLCALHAYSHDINRQVIAHHYCSHYSSEIHQCVIYDSAESNARLVGIEYLISERLYNTLDANEKQLWHSHQYEVSSGLLIAPELNETVENHVMQELCNMYGKITHTWQFDRYPDLPVGVPQLMMSVTDDKYLNQNVLQQHEQQNNYSAKQKQLARSNIEYHETLPGCDSWQHGDAVQYEVKHCDASDDVS